MHLQRYKLLYGAFIRRQHFLPHSESPMAKTSGKLQSVFLHHWCQVWLSGRPVDFNPSYLLRRLETVLELIAVPFKRKLARVFLQALFGACITVCLTERSSLGVVLRGRPDVFLSGNLPSALNLTTCTAVLEQRNLAACPFLCILLHVK